MDNRHISQFFSFNPRCWEFHVESFINNSTPTLIYNMLLENWSSTNQVSYINNDIASLLLIVTDWDLILRRSLSYSHIIYFMHSYSHILCFMHSWSWFTIKLASTFRLGDSKTIYGSHGNYTIYVIPILMQYCHAYLLKF